jgi:hypothetical protein
MENGQGIIGGIDGPPIPMAPKAMGAIAMGLNIGGRPDAGAAHGMGKGNGNGI